MQVDLPGYPALAWRSDLIAPGQSAEGWLFFALPYSASVILRRPKADLFVDRGEPFYGEIRLWKHADEAGERAAGFRHLDVFGVD